jgi:hypothetical protein
MKVNRLPSILEGGGGRDKGGTGKEGGRTGRGEGQGGGKDREGGRTGRGEGQGGGKDREGGRTGRGEDREGGRTGRGYRQGGGTYREGGHTGSGGWWSLSVGARCPRALVVCGRGRRLSAGVRYSWAGSSSSEGDRRCPRWGVILVRSYVGGESLVLYGGSAALVVRGGVVVVYGGSLWVRGGSLWPRASVGGRRLWVGGRRCACVGSLSVRACVGGRPCSWAPDRCSGAVIVGGGRSLSWCVCVAVYVARPDGPSTCHVSNSVVAPFVGRHRRQRASRSSFL